LDDENARLVAGSIATGGVLAAGHWFPWWKPLGPIGAYTYGVLAILLGQGIVLKFNRAWRKTCAVACAAGAVVCGAYVYDWLSRLAAHRLATGDRGDGI